MRNAVLAAAGLFMALSSFARADTPEQYLIAAQAAVQANATQAALDDLDRADALMRGRRASEAALRELRLAREAVVRGDWIQAEDYMGEAMQHPSVSGING